MKVILLQDVKGQGKKGQLIDVSDGYARNFLLPRKLAQEATADNVNTMKMNDTAAQEKRQREREAALALSKVLKDMTLVVTAKGGGGNAAIAGAQIPNKDMRTVLTELVASIDKFYEN